MRSRNIDCVFDVGANSGQYGLFLRSLGYQGYIISFEPVSSVFSELSMGSQNDKKWISCNYALGDKNEQKTINVCKSTVFFSFLKANDYSKNIWHSLEHMEPELVYVKRLDKVWQELTAKLGCNNFMLKLDTQGFDNYVFDGAHSIIRKINVLQSELSLIPVYEGMGQVYDILNKYHKSNFFISGIYPINRDDSLAVIDYDYVMVKRLPE
jgi:FkbM family methyltransferase